MTLWAITRSPLIYGADIREPSLTADDFALMTNERVLAVSANSRGNRQVLSEGGVVVWRASGAATSTVADPDAYVALMNYNQHAVSASVTYQQLAQGHAYKTSCLVTDLWSGKSLGQMNDAVTAQLAASNGAALYSLSSCQ